MYGNVQENTTSCATFNNLLYHEVLRVNALVSFPCMASQTVSVCKHPGLHTDRLVT